MGLFNNYNYLGFFNPFYIQSKGKYLFERNFLNIVNDLKEIEGTPLKIDNIAIIDILTKNYILGDRTLVKGIHKTSWMARPNKECTQWDYYKELKFDNNEFDQGEIVNQFFRLLKEEMVYFIGDNKNIGILLSGGMDSRIVAGVLDSLIKNKVITGVKVKAFTWGNKNSRDVVYAKIIAKRLGWKFKHFELTPEDLLNNIEETAKRGCEYSPTHLHAMLKIREENGVDCIIAGSFGDSIGRGEYSGKKALQLTDLRKNINNRFGFFRKGIIKDYMNSIDQDIESYWKIFPQIEKHQQIEQDYQIHYWRRMLNPCMSVVNEQTPLYQCFTSPELVKFIWSINPTLRNDNIYKGLLKKFDTDLTDIPWARTGLKYGTPDGCPDDYEKDHHSYSKFINEDIYKEIKGLALSKNIAQLNIFNMKAIENTFSIMKTPSYIRDIRVENNLIWLASLSRFIDLYNIDLKPTVKKKNNLNDYFNTFIPLKNNIINIGKSFYRKIIK